MAASRIRKLTVRNSRDAAMISLLGIFIIISIIFLGSNWITLSNSAVTGGSIIEPCFDSDSEENFYVKGYAEYRTKRWEDTCSSDGVRLQQAHCKSSVKVSMLPSFQCPYGCKEGACIALEANCGNRMLDYGEGCDDGNVLAGDGCDSACEKELGFTCKTVSVCSQGT